MTIGNWKIEFPDQAFDAIIPAGQTRLGRLFCNDALSVVLTAGFLNQLVNPSSNAQSGLATQGYLPLPNDFWLISYSGGSGLFALSINGSGVITLSQALAANGNVSVPLTAAQFNGMYAAPVALVAAPGANQLIIVNHMELIMTFGSADYAAGGVVAAQYDNTVHGAGVLATNSEAAADFFAAASTTFRFTRSILLAPFATSVNKAIYLSNATQPFTTGDSTFVANVNYSILKVA